MKHCENRTETGWRDFSLIPDEVQKLVSGSDDIAAPQPIRLIASVRRSQGVASAPLRLRLAVETLPSGYQVL